MKIILIHDGTDHESLLLTSLVIGLKKKFVDSKIVWAGRPDCFQLVKYNKRIRKIVDLKDKNKPHVCDICINPYTTESALNFVDSCETNKVLGFSKHGPVDHNAEFFNNVLYGDLRTNKTILDLYYGLADMQWQGEGYGLSYYPRNKQIKDHGCYFINNHDPVTIPNIPLPSKIFAKLDAINEYKSIHTDDLFVLHAGLALRKDMVFYKDLPYQLNFGAKIHQDQAQD